MTIQNISLFQNLNRSMVRDQKKLEIISDNLARSDIPHEKTKALKENSFNTLVKGGNSAGSLKTTNGRHIPGSNTGGASFKVISQKPKNGDLTLTGNGIKPQEELRKLNDVQMNTLEMQTQYSSFMKRFKTILGTR